MAWPRVVTKDGLNETRMSFVSLNLPSTRFTADRSQWPEKAEERCKFGQRVLWLDETNGGRHLEPHQLELYRRIGDDPVDQLLAMMEEDGRPLRAGDDLVQLAAACFFSRYRNNSTSDMKPPKLVELSCETQTSLANFYSYYYQLPSWANLDDILEGRRVLLSYFPAIGATLYYRSLVPGFSIPKIAAVLFATGYLAPPSSRERVLDRLHDTGALLGMLARGGSNTFVCDLLGGGSAWTAILQVRALHAKVRRCLLRARRTGRTWDAHHLGVPINQEDMVATLLSFSTNVLLGCEMILGFPLPAEERRSYMAFWRYVGWLLGVPTTHDQTMGHQGLRPLDPCGNGWAVSGTCVPDHPQALLQSIIFHLMDPDKSSAALAHHLLRVGRRQNAQPNDNWFYFRCLQCRRFVGHPLADALQLPLHPKWHYRLFLWMVSTSYLVILRFYTMLSLPCSPFRGTFLRYHQRITHSFLEQWPRAHLNRMRTNLLGLLGARAMGEEICPFALSSPLSIGGDAGTLE